MRSGCIMKIQSAVARDTLESPTDRLNQPKYFWFKISILESTYLIWRHSEKSVCGDPRHPRFIDRPTVVSEKFLMQNQAFWRPNMQFDETFVKSLIFEILGLEFKKIKNFENFFKDQIIQMLVFLSVFLLNIIIVLCLFLTR